MLNKSINVMKIKNFRNRGNESEGRIITMQNVENDLEIGTIIEKFMKIY